MRDRVGRDFELTQDDGMARTFVVECEPAILVPDLLEAAFESDPARLAAAN